MLKERAIVRVPEFRQALALFLRSPQTRLIRHLWRRMKEDPGYAVRNRASIERVIADILLIQGLDAGLVFADGGVFQLISVAAKRLTARAQPE